MYFRVTLISKILEFQKSVHCTYYIAIFDQYEILINGKMYTIALKKGRKYLKNKSIDEFGGFRVSNFFGLLK